MKRDLKQLERTLGQTHDDEIDVEVVAIKVCNLAIVSALQQREDRPSLCP